MSFAARRMGSLIFTRRMGGAAEPFFSEGKQTARNGFLFNETPPPPGQSRKWESWEAPWCVRQRRVRFVTLPHDIPAHFLWDRRIRDDGTGNSVEGN